MTVGIVGDSFSGMTSTGITSSSNDVKLTAGGDLAINQAVNTGSANLTLSDTGNVTQSASGILTAGGLQLLGSGSVHLDNPNNDVTTLAANFNGPISYTDKTALTVGIVGDSFSGMTSTGITSSSNDVKLTAGGDLAINQAVNTGSANLTLSDTGNVTQVASGILTAGGLQLLGSGSVHLDNPNNDVTTLAANFNGPISYTDKTALTVGIVGDSFSGMTSTGITSSSNDVKLTAGGDLAINQAVNTGTANLTLSDTGNVTQSASGILTAGGLQLLGSGSVHLDNPNNDVSTLAANFSGPISYTDKTALTVGIVGDSFSGMTSTGITSSSNDVKLTAGGDLAINQAVNTGTANLTLSDTGNVTQSASGILTAGGLQLLGSGSVHLDNPNNDVTTLAATFNGPISYTDKTALTVGIVGDSFSGMTSTGITSSSNDVKLTAGGDLAINQAVNTGTPISP